MTTFPENSDKEIGSSLVNDAKVKRDIVVISSSWSVSFIINVIEYIQTKDPFILKTINVELANKFKTRFRYEPNSYLIENISYIEDSLLLNEFSDYKFMTLYELTETIIKTYSLNEFSSEIAYMQFLQNVILDTSYDKNLGISGFLQWWHEEGNALSVNISAISSAGT